MSYQSAEGLNIICNDTQYECIIYCQNEGCYDIETDLFCDQVELESDNNENGYNYNYDVVQICTLTSQQPTVAPTIATFETTLKMTASADSTSINIKSSDTVTRTNFIISVNNATVTGPGSVDIDHDHESTIERLANFLDGITYIVAGVLVVSGLFLVVVSYNLHSSRHEIRLMSYELHSDRLMNSKEINKNYNYVCNINLKIDDLGSEDNYKQKL